MGIHAANPAAADLQADNQSKQQDLAVETRLAQVSANPAVDTEVDKRRERPDFFFFHKTAVHSGNGTYGQIKRQAEIFMVQHGRQRQHRPASQCRPGTHKNAKKDGCFKGDIGGIKVRHDNTHPYPQCERNTDKSQQAQGLSGVTVFRKEEPLKGAGAGQGAGYSSSHTQLDEQSNQDELRLVHAFTLVEQRYACTAVYGWPGSKAAAFFRSASASAERPCLS